MTLKSIALTSFLPPVTTWPAPTLEMDLGENVTALAYCADGAMLAILAYDARRMLNNLKQGILWQQLAALKSKSQWAYLILYDAPTPGRMATSKAPMVEFLDQQSGVVETTGWHWAAYQGCLMSIQELGVITLIIPAEADIGPAVGALGRRDRSTKRVSPVRTLEVQTPAEALLLTLPGVGETLMLRLLQETGGNAVAALMILTDPAYPFAELGDKTRASVRQALGLKADEAIELRVVALESEAAA